MPTTNASLANVEVLDPLHKHLGPLSDPVALGSGGSCWRFVAGGRRLIAKRMPATRPVNELAAVWSALGPRVCPPLLDHVDDSSGWWALFVDLDGRSSTAWSPRLLELLPHLWACERRPTIDLVDEWTQRLSAFRYRDAAAELLRRRLFAQRPSSTPVLAHGDFAPQNLLEIPTGALLVDWEQCGSAPQAFDAGWLSALVRAELTPTGSPASLTRQLERLQIDADELRWCEGLGLLRLLYRVRTANMSANGRSAAAARLRVAILHHLD